MNTLNKDAYVRELIDPISAVWNTNLINQIFTQEEGSVIHSIPISQLGLQDKIRWQLTDNG